MRAATKLAVALGLCTFLCVAAYGAVLTDRETRRTERVVDQDLASTGRVLASVTSATWKRDGEASARDLLRAAEVDGLSVEILPTGHVDGHGSSGAAVRVPLATPEGERVLEVRQAMPKEGISSVARFSLSMAFVFALIGGWLAYWLTHVALRNAPVRAAQPDRRLVSAASIVVPQRRVRAAPQRV